MDMHFATIWEAIADQIGDHPAIVSGAVRRSWGDWDDRSARVSAALIAAGLKPDAKVGLYLYNSVEYCEVQFGAFKGRMVPINVNYRYLDDELLYLLENSDAEALFFHSSLGDRVARVMPKADAVKLWVQVDDGGDPIDGAIHYSDLIADNEPAERITRSEDDLYMLYTGGTTGMPKGVMYTMGGMSENFSRTAFVTLGCPMPESAKQIGVAVREAIDDDRAVVSIPACPMMHGTGGWIGTMMPHCVGGTVVALESRSLDSDEVWQAAQEERATQIVIVGDAFGKPMVRALEAAKAEGKAYDTSSVKLIVSSGVMWSSEVKEQMAEWGDYMLYDAMGSSEGTMGVSISGKNIPSTTAKFSQSPTTKVFTEDGREVQPGSGEVGLVAAGGNVPLGYYKDEAKSAATFKMIDGVRYSFPGDFARVEADGSLTLLGRGSQCINTAGEKVYPEEVEEAVKRHPDVIDCLVVGVEDEKFGQRVTAVASLVEGSELSSEDLRNDLRERISAFKIPKQVYFEDTVQRAPNGKADYKWAREIAERRD
jgi:acyl-CoA synthetase (AMP-forming)/AMP-acid ligase II